MTLIFGIIVALAATWVVGQIIRKVEGQDDRIRERMRKRLEDAGIE
jgi:hypothetical protein